MNQTRSARLVDAFINHPSIRPTLEQGTHRLESAELLSDERNLVFVNDTGIVIFTPTHDGEYQGHMAFIPEGRGREMLNSCHEALRAVFNLGAKRIIAKVPIQLPAPRLACHWLGFTSHGSDGASEVFTLEREAYGRDHSIDLR